MIGFHPDDQIPSSCQSRILQIPGGPPPQIGHLLMDCRLGFETTTQDEFACSHACVMGMFELWGSLDPLHTLHQTPAPPVHDVAVVQVLERQKDTGRVKARGRDRQPPPGGLLKVVEELAPRHVAHQHVHARRVAVHRVPAHARISRQPITSEV